MAESAAGEKTEAPTPRRLQEARRRGEVAQSRDLAAAAVLVVVYGALALSAEAWIGGLIAYTRSALMTSSSDLVAPAVFARAVHGWMGAVAAPIGAAFFASVLIGVLQTRGLFAPAAVRIDPGRVSPSLKKVFSAAALVEVAKGLAKVALVGAVVGSTLRPWLPHIGNIAGGRASRVLGVLGEMTTTLGLRLGIVAVALGAFDLLWQHRRHLKSLRMTRDEVKREHKENEGDPHHKAERSRLHQELLEQRMVEDVRKADFVVVNPDHIAVALRYDRDSQAAPMVVAKGERLLAERIKQVARASGVPIFRDVTLARSLRHVREGDEIPEALYEAVAEILRVVQSPQNVSGSDRPGHSSAGPPPHGRRA